MPHRIIGVLDITEHPGPGGTGLDAGRSQPPGNTVITPGAFVSRFSSGVKESAGIGTGLNAVATPHAPFAIHENQPVGGEVGRTEGTDLNAWGLGAVIAHFGNVIGLGHALGSSGAGGEPVKASIGGINLDRPVATLLVTLHPGPVELVGHIIFLLARPDAGPAADTLFQIYDVGE